MRAITNLPLQLTSFIGRERELAEVKQLLSVSRLVTLTGAGGCGKTRLANQVSTQVIDSFNHGVCWVELAKLTDSALVTQALTKALNITEQTGRTSIETILDFLRDKGLLLVLDNCEHLLTSCVELVQTLLRDTADLRVLATSREPLAVTGEMLYPLSPLALPPSDQVTEIGRFDAIRLFVERAHQVLPAFELRDENAFVVAEICRRLDGIPLAIELASARVNVLSVQQIAARLDDRFVLLSTAPRDVPAHHHTLRKAIDWSFDLLSPSEQILFRRLAVFVGGWTLDTAESVCTDESLVREQLAETLFLLVNKSLVVAETLSSGVARYHFLETIRVYAQEKLNEAGEATPLRDRFLDHFVALAEETVPKLQNEYQKLWLNWIEQEQDNFGAALKWGLESHQVEMALRLTIALFDFWARRGYVTEGLDWFVRVLGQRNGSESARLQAQAATSCSFLAAMIGDAPNAIAYGKEAVSLCENEGEEAKPLLATACTAVSRGARFAGDYATSFDYGNRALALSREMDERLSLGMSLLGQGYMAIELGQLESARQLLEEGLQVNEQLDDPFRIALALNFLGDLERCEGNNLRARSRYEQSLARFEELDAKREVASVLHNLAYTFLHQNELERAADLFRQSLELQQASGNRGGIAECLTGFSAIAAQQHKPEQAALLLAFAANLSRKDAPPIWGAERMEYERVQGTLRKQLSPQQLEVVKSRVQKWSLEQAAAYATNQPLTDNNAALQSKPFSELSARELEIVILIAEGKSNSEIAGHLVLSKRTVEKHVANILGKLGFKNRAQVARWATENGLIKRKK